MRIQWENFCWEKWWNNMNKLFYAFISFYTIFDFGCIIYWWITKFTHTKGFIKKGYLTGNEDVFGIYGPWSHAPTSATLSGHKWCPWQCCKYWFVLKLPFLRTSLPKEKTVIFTETSIKTELLIFNLKIFSELRKNLL